MEMKRQKDYSRPLTLQDYENPTIDWTTPIMEGLRQDLDVQARLNEAVNRAFRTIDDVIDFLTTTHMELPNPRSDYNLEKLKKQADELRNKLKEYISDYDYKKVRYQALIHFCDDNGIAYSLPIFPDDNIELLHEKTGTIKFPSGKSQPEIIEIMNKLIS